VTNDRKSVARAFATIATFLALVDAIDVMTILHDAGQRGEAMSAWKPATLEFTSGVAMLAVSGIALLALRQARPGRSGWLRLLAVHGAASLIFSALHFLLMNALRIAIYAAKGRHYRFAPSEFVYEYRKDLIAYLVLAGIFWLFTRVGPAVAAAPAARRSFDIVDGNRVLRTPLGEIAALRGAGNYVEFLLRDGGRPLMRAPLGEIEAALAASGFVRVHRSWAVNLALVRALEPAGSGNYTVVLEGGIEAPVSRRFPEALARLRA
jgi:DNA-binding LytR/AlgR family response regulator